MARREWVHGVLHPCFSPVRIRAGSSMIDLCDTASAQFLDLRNEGVCLVKLLHIIATTNALALNQDIGYSPSTCGLGQECL